MSEPRKNDGNGVCDLCALENPSQPFNLSSDEGEKRFCCEGCLEVYALLHGIDDRLTDQTADSAVG